MAGDCTPIAKEERKKQHRWSSVYHPPCGFKAQSCTAVDWMQSDHSPKASLHLLLHFYFTPKQHFDLAFPQSSLNPHPTPGMHLPQVTPTSTVHCSEWGKTAQPCAEPATALQRNSTEWVGKQHSFAHCLQEASRTSILHPGVSSCLQTPAMKGWVCSQDCVYKKGACAAAIQKDPLLHGWEGGIPTLAALRGPWDSLGYRRAASSRKAAAVCPYTCC